MAPFSDPSRRESFLLTPEECAALRRQISEVKSDIRRYREQFNTATGARREMLAQDIDRLADALEEYESQEIEGGCADPSPFPPPKVRITFVENTQAVQSWTNPVPLVSGKDTALRVYIDHPYPSGAITGEVFSQAHSGGVAQLLNGPIEGRRSTDINRSRIDDTLNFRIPGSLCHGDVKCAVVVWDPARPHDPLYKDSMELLLRFSPIPNLRLWAYLVRYTGPDAAGNPSNLPPPTLDNLRNTLGFVEKVYPIAEITYLGLQELVIDADMRAGGTACGSGWDAILDKLRGLKAWGQTLAELAGQDWIGSHDVFVALVPSATPTFNATGGCGGGGVAAAYTFQGQVMAQEIAHALGRMHAPGCGAPAVDPDYPNVGPVGSIYEHGFDVAANLVLNPAFTVDFMSYCPVGQWVSPYTYEGLMAALRVQTGGGEAPRGLIDRHEHETLHLTFRLGRDGTVKLGPSFHLAGPGMTFEDRPQSNVTLDLVAAEEVVAFHRCHIEQPAYYDPDLPYLHFDEALPWFDNLEEIIVRRDGKECSRIQVEREAPVLKSLAVTPINNGDALRLTWETIARSKAAPPRFGILYSNDDGGSWRPLDFGLTQNSYETTVQYLPGGDRCKFRVLASAGVRTTSAESEIISVARKGAWVSIKDTGLQRSKAEGETLMLEGAAFSPETGSVPSEDLVWTSNIDGMIGSGSRVSTASLSVGRHRITLSALGPNGEETSVHTMLFVKRKT